MASIRRTLSPIPRSGTLLNGEACSVASPLSKSSSCTQNHPPSSGGLLSSLYSSLDSQSLIFGVYSPRSSRPLDRAKPKGQVWRRALFHFWIFFVVGAFIGLTPFVSMNLSTNVLSKQQVFPFEMVSAVGNFQTYDDVTRNVTMLMDRESIKDNATLESQGKEPERIEVVLDDIPTNQSLPQDSAWVQKLLIIVTPTYARPFQAYYLNRLAHTLRMVQPPLLWMIVETTSQSEETADVLRRTGVMYRHLFCNKNLSDMKDKSIHQRNVALSHIENHHLDGIIYFADENNIYSTDLFEEMRQIRRFGTWRVAKVTENEVEAMDGPICDGTQVIGWHVNGPRRRFRRFHTEMPGFAFNSTILWDPKAWHRPTLEPIRQIDTVKDGLQASAFIEQIVEDERQMEGLLGQCSRIMVWHLPLESSIYFYPQKWVLKNNLDVIALLA